MDPDNYWSQTTTRSTGTNVERLKTDYVYKDYGVGHFASPWTHNFDLKITSTTVSGGFLLYMQSNSLAEWIAQSNAICIRFTVTDAGGTLHIILNDRVTGSDSHINTGHDGTKTYYCKLSRSGTALALLIYNDAARTSLLDTVAVTMIDQDYRYLYGGCTINSGTSGEPISGHIEYLDLTPAPPPPEHFMQPKKYW